MPVCGGPVKATPIAGKSTALLQVLMQTNIAPVAVDPSRLRIVFYPDPVLRRKAEPIGEVTDEVRLVADRMLDLMREAKGVGLAAPQVGLPWRMFVVNATGEPGDDHVFINPHLSDPSRTQTSVEEGCLSLPDIRAQIMRPQGITINALDLQGQPVQYTSDDFPARVWQHEFDHLEGILILDKMDRLDKIANRRQIKRLEEKP